MFFCQGFFKKNRKIIIIIAIFLIAGLLIIESQKLFKKTVPKIVRINSTEGQYKLDEKAQFVNFIMGNIKEIKDDFITLDAKKENNSFLTQDRVFVVQIDSQTRILPFPSSGILNIGIDRVGPQNSEANLKIGDSVFITSNKDVRDKEIVIAQEIYLFSSVNLKLK